MTDRKVLSYFDVVLRDQDVQLLTGPHWLNDQIIAFWFEFLSHEVVQELCQASSPDLVFVAPAITFLVASCSPQDAAAILSTLPLDKCKLAFLPVNDNTNVELANGGGHWSLLVYEASSHTLRHYDSGGQGANSRPARQLANALKVCLQKQMPVTLPAGACDAGSSSSLGPAFVDVAQMPHQRNGYDCGVYVCDVAEALAVWYAQNKESAPSLTQLEQKLSGLVVPFAGQLRNRMFKLIQDKQEQARAL